MASSSTRSTTSAGDYDLSDPLNSFVDVVRRVVFDPQFSSQGFLGKGASSTRWCSP
jgi:hypothetical protein